MSSSGSWITLSKSLLEFFRAEYNTFVPALDSKTALEKVRIRPKLSSRVLTFTFLEDHATVSAELDVLSFFLCLFSPEELLSRATASSSPEDGLFCTVDTANFKISKRIDESANFDEIRAALVCVADIESSLAQSLADRVRNEKGDSSGVRFDFFSDQEGVHCRISKGSETFSLRDLNEIHTKISNSAEEWIKILQKQSAPFWVPPLWNAIKDQLKKRKPIL